MSSLGTMEDLPLDYRQGLVDHNLVPLWPGLRNVLPQGRPSNRTLAMMWRYADIRPRLIQAGELTPIEKAERRVLILSNPGHGNPSMQTTATIYVGMQLINPGETAPNHRHIPSAIRFVIEGSGGFTAVNGERLDMHPGDLILTPATNWHEHGHEGKGPVIWLDSLDIPLMYYMETSYVIEGPNQQIRNEPDSSQTRYKRSGLVPYEVLDRPRAPYPLMRYPWAEVRDNLVSLAEVTARGEPVQLAYINPETGQECLPTLGFSALMVRPGESVKLRRRSASSVMHVIEGQGECRIDKTELSWTEHDTFAIPTHAEVEISNKSGKKPTFLFVIDDAPLQRKLGIYEVFQ